MPQDCWCLPLSRAIRWEKKDVSAFYAALFFAKNLFRPYSTRRAHLHCHCCTPIKYWLLNGQRKASEQFAICRKQGCCFAARKHVLTAELGAQLSAQHQHQFLLWASVSLERKSIISSLDSYYFTLLLERSYEKQLKIYILQRSHVQPAINVLMVLHNVKEESKGSWNALWHYSEMNG